MLSRHKENDGYGVQAIKPRKLRRRTVPALSFVDATLLHGVACPIGGDLVGTDSSIPPRPIIIMLENGEFKGPNGRTVNMGTMHLRGLCSARRTSDSDVGRAEISIQSLSYWDADGGSQDMAVTGYIVDSRDNEMDVAGLIDKVTYAVLHKEALAAAFSAYATTLSQAEFSTVTTPEGNATRTLTGDTATAAAASSVAGMFVRIAQRFEDEANSAIDTVRLPPGIPLRFYLDTKISVLEAANPIEELADQSYDVLL